MPNRIEDSIYENWMFWMVSRAPYGDVDTETFTALEREDGTVKWLKPQWAESTWVRYLSSDCSGSHQAALGSCQQ